MEEKTNLNWNQVKTEEQKQRLLSMLHESLERLRKSPSLKDLLEERIEIGNNRRKLYITRKGVMEMDIRMDGVVIYREPIKDEEIDEYFEIFQTLPKYIDRIREEIED